jgi:F-type H+-transporting ATPase subunit b
MPQLDTSTFPSQLFWLGVCFLTLYFILSFVAVPKITRVFERRDEAIAAQINKASTYREQAEDLLADYEKTLADARDAAHQHAKSIASATNAEIGNKQKDYLDKMKDRLHLAEQDLYRSRIEASHEITSIAAEVANAVLTKLTGQSYPLDKPLKSRKEA